MKRVDNKIQLRIIYLLLFSTFLSLFTLFLVQELNFSKSLNFTDIEKNENFTIKTCNDISIENIKNTEVDYTFSYKFIDIYPEIENMRCLGKVVDIWTNEENLNSLHFLYGSNQKLYDYLNFIGNGFFLLIVLFLKKFNFTSSNLKFLNITNIIVFNFLLNYLFKKTPGSIFQFLDLNILIILFTFLFMFLSIDLKNFKLFLIGLLFFITFNYDFFGVYVLSFLLSNKFRVDINEKDFKYVILFPPIFYLQRFIGALSEEFNIFWSGLFQNFYFGFSRFVDLQADFHILNCHTDQASPYNINFTEIVNYCSDTIGYGPIRKLIPLYGDIWMTVLFALFILFIIILYQYKQIVLKYPTEILISTLFLISPSVNLLIHLSNPDIFYFAFIYFFLKNYENNPILYSGIIYIFTLWKIHAVGILFGLLFCALVKKNQRVIKTNIFFIFLTLVTYVVDVIFTEPLTIPGSPDERLAYGILHDALQLTKFTNYGNTLQYVFFTIILSVIILFTSKNLTKLYGNEDIKRFSTYEFYGYSYWFFLTFIFQNQSYRLPLFMILFIYLFKNSENFLKISLSLAIFLNPVFSNEYLIFEKISLIGNRFGLYIVFTALFTIFFSDFYSNFVSRFLKIKFLENFKI